MTRRVGRRSRRRDVAEAERCRWAGVIALAAALCLGGGTAALAVSAELALQSSATEPEIHEHLTGPLDAEDPGPMGMLGALGMVAAGFTGLGAAVSVIRRASA